MKNFVKMIALVLSFAAPVVFAAGEVEKKAPAVYTGKTAKLNRAQVDEWLAKPDKVVFIDLRRPDELTRIGGLPVYLSIQLADLEKNIAYIPKDRSVVTISNHANRAFKAGDILREKGFKIAGAVGVQDYEQEGGTLTKIVPPAPKPANASVEVK